MFSMSITRSDLPEGWTKANWESRKWMFMAGVLGFEESVRIEQTAISGRNADFHRSVSCFGKHAQHQSVLFDFPYVTRGAGGQHERGVACSGVVKQALLQIHEEISGGDEVLFELAAESTVQAGENAHGIVGVSRLTREGDLEHGGDQRSRHAVSSDVGDQNTDALLVYAEEIIEIASDSAHGRVPRSNFESCEGGDALRKREGLNP